MKFILIDDEIPSLRNLERTLSKLYPEVEMIATDNYQEVLKNVDDSVKVAFLDIEMPGMTGIELAKELLKKNPELNIIFVTAYDDYAREAYRVHASGYLTKPYDTMDIIREMENLRYPIPVTKRKMRVQCFGNFEVFYGDEPIHFERKGSKEILAYLINQRGSSSNRVEICTAMWQNEEEVERRKTYFRTLIFSLRNTLKEYDAEEIFINHRDSYAVNTALIDCDYYRYLDGEQGLHIQYRGDFMSQYEWAQKTAEQLNAALNLE